LELRVDQGRTPSEGQHTLGNERRREPLGHRGPRSLAAAFAVAALASATLVALVTVVAGADHVPGAELALLGFVSLIVAGAAGKAIHRRVRKVHTAALEYRSIVETAAESFISADSDGRIVEWNRKAERDFGWSREEVIGRTVAETVVPPRLRDAYGEGISRFLRTGGPRLLGRPLELQVMHRDGHEFPVEVTISLLRTGGGGYRFNAFLRDIAERKQAEAKLAHQAMHDPLTGLPNRTLFNDRMLLAKARLMRGGSLAVLFCDLDRFKAVNDGFGHEAGDRLLIEVAGRLASTLRPSDTVARFGGDEFALLCEGVGLESAERVASRIEDAFSAPFLIDGHEVSVTTSIGIVLTTDPDASPDQLVSDADFAMYAAKQDGGARHVVFGRRLRQPPAFPSEGRRSRRRGRRAVGPTSHS
jgi:diguanylate cyclase (GGDEF)-like protein/PAS domain S-box-containing protein